MVNAQEWLDREYPKEERNKIKELDISNKELEGKLDLGDFKNLEELYCLKNKLTVLSLNNCSQLEEINCSDNQLTDLDISNCFSLIELNCRGNFLTNLALPKVPTNLRKLDLTNNNFSSQNLSFLIPATYLERIELGNRDEKKINQGIYNRWTGSLNYLSGMKRLWLLDISNTDLNEVNLYKLPQSLEKIEYSTELRSNSKLNQIISQLEEHEYEWKDIHSDFVLEFQRGWEKEGFTKEQTKKWIEVGVEPWDYQFISCLKKGKKVSPEWILDNKGEFENLKLRFQEYSVCQNCNQPNTSESWCQSCAEREWVQDLKQLVGQAVVEKFIKKQHLREIDEWDKLKWIPYEEFTDVKKIGEGGFSKVYKTNWNRSKVYFKDTYILKFLNNSREITIDFLQEVANNKLFDADSQIVRCFGISQNLQTGDYAIVMRYMKDGDLRRYLQQKGKELNWVKKFEKLGYIAKGLDDIHKQGLVHRDLHMGNILSDYDIVYIADLGLSKPTNFQTEEKKVYGIIPYIDPKVLKGGEYTQASDIYSFGIVMYEVFSGTPPFHNVEHDAFLAVKICQGLRPKFNVRIPQSLKDLIEKCWSNESNRRPSASELVEILKNWIYYDEKDIEFAQQIREVEEFNQTLSEEIRFPEYKIHPKAIYTSRQINTKKISELLEKIEGTNISKSIELNIDELEQDLKDLERKNSWQNLHPNFKNNPELVKKWTDKGFTYQRVKHLVNILSDKFDTNDYDWFENSIQELKKRGAYDNLEHLKQLLNDILKKEKNPLESSEITEIRFSEVDLTGKKELKSEQITKIWTSEVDLTASSLISGKEEENLKVKRAELMKIDPKLNWSNNYLFFTPQLTQYWTNLNFTYQQTQDWINAGLQPTDYNFCAWLRDNKYLTPEQVLNHHNLEKLNQEFFNWWQEQQQTKIETPPK